MWVIIVKGTEWAIGHTWYSKLDAQKAADKLAEEAKHGEEYEVVFQELSADDLVQELS